MKTATPTSWRMTGHGYEFCNCDFGCGCNFDGFPSSADGSCQALVGFSVTHGYCGDVALDGVKGAGIYAWPAAIHDGGGSAVFLLDVATTEPQAEALQRIFTGQLGGLPWDILAPTFQVVGVQRRRISIEGEGRNSVLRIEGVGEGRGDTLKNPVTGEDTIVNIDLPRGFIWSKGQAGRGSFRASAAGISLAFENTNWIYYDYDWSNASEATGTVA
jgi:hypothetical protein